jgi:hypothetical protein
MPAMPRAANTVQVTDRAIASAHALHDERLLAASVHRAAVRERVLANLVNVDPVLAAAVAPDHSGIVHAFPLHAAIA